MTYVLFFYFSTCALNYPAPDFKIKADGAEDRRAASIKRNASIRQKYGLDYN